MKPMPKFDYIAYHCTDDGYKIDGFSLFANVLSTTENTVTYERYMDFGELKSKNPVTVSKGDFETYYAPMTDEIYQKCLEARGGVPNE